MVADFEIGVAWEDIFDKLYRIRRLSPANMGIKHIDGGKVEINDEVFEIELLVLLG